MLPWFEKLDKTLQIKQPSSSINESWIHSKYLLAGQVSGPTLSPSILRADR